ncbi:MAG: 1-deoxy-D-xylulose-5-phosphate synthase, partial [Duodenibacillus sp.]|nr:1-deoxy-D-xylulose-5-phosphate synthase [Duodenibacillus sp.]
AALVMAVADQLLGKDDSWHIAVIGDGALTGGMAVEALNQAGVCKEGVKLLIILNDNDCSISPPVGALSGNLARLVSTSPVWKVREISKSVLQNVPPLWELAKRVEKQTVNFLSPPSSIFSSFDLNYFGPVDGNDVIGLVQMLARLKRMNSPVVLHVSTVKGKGYPPAESDPTLYHGVGKFDPRAGIAGKPADPERPTYTEVFSRWICDMAAADERLYGITPAMREGSGLVEFEKRFPARYKDVAIAEQHAVTYAAGLAAAGMHPVVAIYSSFAQRAYDQILHDVALQNLPVAFAVDRGGLVGADGATHHGVFDIAYLRSLPNFVVMTPSDEDECRRMLTTAVRLGRPAAVRYPRGKGPGARQSEGLQEVPFPPQARTLRRSAAPSGRRVAFLAFGAMTCRLRALADELDATLVDMRFAKPLDESAVLAAADGHDLVVTAEDGVIAGGAGSAVAECIAMNGRARPLLMIGIPDRFIEHGDTEELYRECGMDAASVREAVLGRLARLAAGGKGGA